MHSVPEGEFSMREASSGQKRDLHPRHGPEPAVPTKFRELAGGFPLVSALLPVLLAEFTEYEVLSSKKLALPI
jgi:hypothetical protein